jgi:hypothetical protein
MLDPDVLEILQDPEVGGGVAFKVKRKTTTRILGGDKTTEEVFDLTGSIQPQDKSIQSSTAEDLKTEIIVVRAPFAFQTGSNSGKTIIQTDIIVWKDASWRVTRVDDWSEWGYSTAYATKDMG